MSSSIDNPNGAMAEKSHALYSPDEVSKELNVEAEGGDGSLSDFDGFTKYDKRDMRRMGKCQEFTRNFRPFSTLAFAVVLQATWEFLLIANTQGLTNGGLAGLFWSYLWTYIGFIFIILSLAEMSSMAPTSGGQYHWVSEFAPPQYQKILSYVTGWMSVLSWQAGTASGSFLTGTIIQALIGVNSPDYQPANWQGTLLVFAMALLVYICNVWGARELPLAQKFLVVVHVLAFLAVIIVLWAIAPHQSATAVFTEFTNGGGWSSVGLSLMIGQISAIFASTCSDATAHMSEEIADAGRYVPIAMFWSFIFNGLLAILVLITYLFALSSIDDALADPSTFPFIYVFQSVLPTAGVNGLTITILVLVIASNVSFNASTSRQTWAFARDNGLPFSKWIARVHPTKEIPANAVALSCVITALLSLINIESTVALNAIISLQLVALMLTYSISISCVLYRRLRHPELLPPARWSLGCWGVGINVVGLAYSVFAFFWSFWPSQTPVDAMSFNWAVVIFGVVAAGCLAMYVVRGRRVYVGPVVGVEGRRLG
ncbi:hypothetical protein MMC30_007430 [Trapelia coarctata]|nr:hypothetical protein [Trapelia coarctata]